MKGSPLKNKVGVETCISNPETCQKEMGIVNEGVPTWPHWGTALSVEVADVVVLVTVVSVVAIVVAAGAPRSEATALRNPELAQSWLISHIMTPPKLEKLLLYAIIDARVLPDS